MKLYKKYLITEAVAPRPPKNRAIKYSNYGALKPISKKDKVRLKLNTIDDEIKFLQEYLKGIKVYLKWYTDSKVSKGAKLWSIRKYDSRYNGFRDEIDGLSSRIKDLKDKLKKQKTKKK